MALDFQNQASEIQKMDIPELIPTVQFLFERYIRELVKPGYDKPYYLSLRTKYYRLYGNKRTMVQNTGTDTLPKVIIEGDEYFVDMKTHIDTVRSLALGLLGALIENETLKNT